jgi:hypothetical protein
MLRKALVKAGYLRVSVPAHRALNLTGGHPDHCVCPRSSLLIISEHKTAYAFEGRPAFSAAVL